MARDTTFTGGQIFFPNQVSKSRAGSFLAIFGDIPKFSDHRVDIGGWNGEGAMAESPGNVDADHFTL